ncbi:hypothetical protein [Streptomyces zagrosensis]|uniref:Uncharacterized protein n=1 Tax=Streptomyces zagrosensis TaxID=1042984 RepID=A0A7W9Q8R3_9ACTN|nr:hypothetical protein [Streptomyces zagrosensis]MBB5935233.1 hypothetical protein [Streptomyces zagrosensis]
MQKPEHWPPAPEPIDAKLSQLLALNDQLASDVPLVEDADADAKPSTQPCATCRAVAIVRDRARALRDWPQYREAVDALHAHRGAGHRRENSGPPVSSPGKRSLVLTGQHTVRTVQGTVLRFFLANANANTDRSDPVNGWEPATDVEFQQAYEGALFDPKALAEGELRTNPHRIQLPLDALAGAGGFFWSDGADAAGIMTTNGKTPSDCGLDHLADTPATPDSTP